MNSYELTSPEILNALCDQIAKGIKTEIILEGQPVGGFSEHAKASRDKIVAAMEDASKIAASKFFVMASNAKKPRRYHYNHAKYIIIDESVLLVGSENYTRTGNPIPNGKGNRGWQTLIHDSTMAMSFLKMFNADKDSSFGDITQLVKAGKPKSENLFASFSFGFEETNSRSLSPALQSWANNNAPLSLEADHIEQLTSPNTSLEGLIAFIDKSQKTLDFELMSFNAKWGTTGTESPLIKALVRAARRGVVTRLLLNDETVFGPHFDERGATVKVTTNAKTVEYLNRLAEKEGFDLSATIADVKAMGVTYIHNKGALSDGFKTLVSSINWNENSIEKNREAAVSISSEEINQHYAALFEKDWNNSIK